ncbi:MAG TPA: valine--tRNA ligase [Pseudolabrys sp.]|uniref:valine--tRNA ligase n=1 Tax=Pseudolabrys sp. TaxID=1960880 RepID=UPI002DDD32F0|nr:valine--tRNA ligase [Pseudolabrys sp.]HEV2627276.1 valine--tRNA ligase [Pseudolabrys sp.]
MIDKTYQPSDVEGRIYRAWEEAGAFRAGRPERAQAETYSIVIPPPNVTGSLHMGHALNNTLQDVLARFERMRGKDVLWQPGTDHAGIATQMVVERQLMERQEPGRREMGREKFLERVWAWKAESGGTIVKQLKRLGASCDWSRERFTMDEGLSKAVLKVFVALYREGLIYKDKRLVNWDPKLLTAISDLEVMPVETKGHLWHLRYPIEGKTFNPEDPSSFIVVATTRPETMLGDTAVAVHPDDERYKGVVGKNVILPLVGRKIPIIADEYSDPEKGSGAVKITPAHDFNDFEVGKRHALPQINILTREARLTFQGNLEFLTGISNSSETAETLAALDRRHVEEARKIIVSLLESKGYVEKIEPHTHAVPRGDRSNVIIEPFLTNQWYVNAHELAKPALAAVREGKTNFVPKNWEATYFNWMENIQPWCISRQLWWGHQIPAWYGRKEGPRVEGEIKSWLSIEDHPEIFVAATEDEAIAAAKAHFNCDVRIVPRPVDDLDPLFQQLIDDELAGKPRWEPIWRDEDVLDTWFSSALWPFSTLGWPEETKELKRFYPTSALVTGFDIIFFWVARMMMMGLHFMQKERPGAPLEQAVPFKDVYIHRLVRDERGQKMSKSKGNVVDPLGIIDEYGADALRFTLMRAVAPSHDIRLGPQDVENNRNFATKLWNAARFVEFNGARRVAGFDPKSAKEVLNRWIAHETQKAAAEITAAIETYAFSEAAGAAYRFVWNVYCDWYVELSKPLLTGADGPAKDETRAMAAWVLDQILALLHPFMPFITEELWAVTAEEGPKRDALLALSNWPKLEGLTDDKAEAEIGWVIDLITAIRSIRAEMNLNVVIPVVLAGASAATQALAQRWSDVIKRLARVSEISAGASAPAGSVQLVVRGEVAALPLKGVIDLGAERARLAKEMQKAEADIARCDGKLNNPKFMERAAEEVVEEEKEKRAEAVTRKARIAEALERLKGAE